SRVGTLGNNCSANHFSYTSHVISSWTEQGMSDAADSAFFCCLFNCLVNNKNVSRYITFLCYYPIIFNKYLIKDSRQNN
ncbi:hypothetical protein L9F63_009702, partial [Diploptera punctata]